MKELEKLLVSKLKRLSELKTQYYQTSESMHYVDNFSQKYNTLSNLREDYWDSIRQTEKDINEIEKKISAL